MALVYSSSLCVHSLHGGFARLTFRRAERLNERAVAERLFRHLDADGSGQITCKRLRVCLAELGLEISQETAFDIMSTIDSDRLGHLNLEDFTAWMENRPSRMKAAVSILKVLVGLGQVISNYEHNMQQQLPGRVWNSDFLNIVKFDAQLVVPICHINYVTLFLLNSMITPCVLLLLVSAVWWTRKTGAEFDPHELIHSKRTDYYFAFFLCYPTMTQTWFDHFDCRRLPDMHVLHADYDIQCFEGVQWWLLAFMSAAGLILVSFGVPCGLYAWMRWHWKAQMSLVKTEQKPCALAYRDLRQKYAFIAGEFRPEAFYAESLDLMRKLCLSGVVSWVAKGSVLQNLCSVLFSLIFVMIHIKVWPYPFAGANMLKLLADFQLVLISLQAN